MELTYIIIAAAILVLTWLLSGSSNDTRTVLGAEPRSKPAGVAGTVRPVLPAAGRLPASGRKIKRQALGTSAKRVMQLVKNGQKIEAIKLLRERTGMGLKQAKDLVDRLG